MYIQAFNTLVTQRWRGWRNDNWLQCNDTWSSRDVNSSERCLKQTENHLIVSEAAFSRTLCITKFQMTTRMSTHNGWLVSVLFDKRHISRLRGSKVKCKTYDKSCGLLKAVILHGLPNLGHT